MPVTGPAGQPEPVFGTTWAQQVTSIYNLIIQRMEAGGTPAPQAQQYAANWLAYANQHKNNDPSQLYLAWFMNESNLPVSLGQDIAAGIGGAANVAGSIPQNISALSPTSEIAGIWGTLTSKSLWIRVAEAIAAFVLLDVGLKSFTGTSVIESGAKTARKVIK